MALGDGIRRNIAMVSDEERTRYINAIVRLDTSKFFADGMSYWDKQHEIHHHLGIHGGVKFVPWHRVLVNHLEDLLREVDPDLSLHYWDWNTDPRVAPPGGAALFTDIFMDNSDAEVSHLLADFESTEPGHPKLWRSVGGSVPMHPTDDTIINTDNYYSLVTHSSRLSNEGPHGFSHAFIGGTISDIHYSFQDPFVFFLHSNLDRLWAKWQTDPAHPERLTPEGAYSGTTDAQAASLANDYIPPWDGGAGVEPWASDPSKREFVTYTDLSVIIPRCYDTNQSSVAAAESENALNLATSRYQVKFNSVPEEETTWRAAVIKVYACSDKTFRVRPGTEPAAPFSIIHDNAVAVYDSRSTHRFAEARIWFAFTAGAAGTAPQNFGPSNVVIECVETPAISFNFELIADTIERPTVAVQLVLDQSGSMNDPAGTSGLNRLTVLKDAANHFTNLIQQNNGIGIVRFDDNAYPPDHPSYGGMFITRVSSDSMTDATRETARDAITAHGAYGNTSVGDGIEMGRMQLDALPAGEYTGKAMIVFTDGLQNQPQSIEAVSSSINNQTFAIGLGTETQVNTLALYNITQGSGGYLLLSGLITSGVDDFYRLTKYFLQVLANVTNTQIIKDPNGYINIGTKLRIPFMVCEAEINARVILLNEYPILNLIVEAPDGQQITVANAAAYNARFESNNLDMVTCSFPLPVLNGSTENHSGTWYAIIEVNEAAYQKYLSNQENRKTELRTKGTKYSVSVHSFSNLKMETRISQSGIEPGAKMVLRSALMEYDVPVQHRAAVTAEVTQPDHSKHMLRFDKKEAGAYEAEMIASLSGIYHFHVIANGVNYKGRPFTREQILTGSVFVGGNNPGTVVGPFGAGSEDRGRKDVCCQLTVRVMWVISVLLLLILIAILVT